MRALVLLPLLLVGGCPLWVTPSLPAFACTHDDDCSRDQGFACDTQKQLCVPAASLPVLLDGGAMPDTGPEDAGPADAGGPSCADDWFRDSYAYRLDVSVNGAVGADFARVVLDEAAASALMAVTGGDPERLHVVAERVERHRRVVRLAFDRVIVDVATRGQGTVPPVGNQLSLYVGERPGGPLDEQRNIYTWFEDFEGQLVGGHAQGRIAPLPQQVWTVQEDDDGRYLHASGDERQTAQLLGTALTQGRLETRVRLHAGGDNHVGLLFGAERFTVDDLNTFGGQFRAGENRAALFAYQLGAFDLLAEDSFGPDEGAALQDDRWMDLALILDDGRVDLLVDQVQRTRFVVDDAPGQLVGLFAFDANADFDDVRAMVMPSTAPSFTASALFPRCTDTPGYCGDGRVDDDESCDDGDLRPGDGCNGSCMPDVAVPAPLGRWTLDDAVAPEGQPAVAEDATGSGLEGNYVNTKPGEDHVRGRFRAFEGDDGVELGQPAALDVAGDLTLSAWVRVGDGSGNYTIIGRGYREAPDREIVLRVRNHNLEGGVWNGTDQPIGTLLSASERHRWVHVAVTHKDGEWRLFVDGLRREAASGPGVEVFDAPWAIGQRGMPENAEDPADRRGFVGALSDVRIYAEGLSDAQIGAVARGAR